MVYLRLRSYLFEIMLIHEVGVISPRDSCYSHKCTAAIVCVQPYTAVYRGHLPKGLICFGVLSKAPLCSLRQIAPSAYDAVEQLSYSVGSSLYYSAKQREASFNNLTDEAIKKREAKLKPLHGACHCKRRCLPRVRFCCNFIYVRCFDRAPFLHAACLLQLLNLRI